MKILHLISGGDTGGAKTHVLTLLNALNEKKDGESGVYVMVVCFVDMAFYKEIAKTDVPSALYGQFNRYDMRVVSKLRKLIKEKRFDIIHAHGARANFIALCLKPFVKRPFITTMHSDYKMDFTVGLYKRYFFTVLNMLSLRFMDYYIAISGNFADMLKERGFKTENIYTVYNAIKIGEKPVFADKTAFLAKYGIPGDKYVVGIIARHDKVKGVDVFLRAAAEVLKQKHDVVFLLAGEGDETDNLKKLADELKISDSVYFLGYINDVDAFLNCMDINALTSYSESFTYVLLEGALHHKATVVTAVGGLPDLIRDGLTGLTAPAGDYKKIAGQIIRLLDNPEERKILGDNLHDLVVNNFSSDSMKKRHLEIYNDVIRRRKDEHKYFDCVLSGYYGFKNSGDDALLFAIVGALRKAKNDIKIAVLTKNKRETAAKHGVYAVNRYNLFKIRKLLLYAKLFISGGGSLIADNSSTRSLVYYTSLIALAKKYGLKIMYYASGVGPVTKKRNELTAKKALDAADRITLRDRGSFEALVKLGADTVNCEVTCDPVLTISPADKHRTDGILTREGLDEADYFIVSVRYWKKSDPEFINKMAETAAWAYINYGLAAVFVNMQPQDMGFTAEIIRKIETPHAVVKGDYGPDELTGVIGRAQFVLSMRLHALIYAAAAGTPAIGVAYDPKVEAFMKSISSENYVSAGNFDAAALTGMIGRIMGNTGDARQKIIEETAKLLRLSGRDAAYAIELLE